MAFKIVKRIRSYSLYLCLIFFIQLIVCSTIIHYFTWKFEPAIISVLIYAGVLQAISFKFFLETKGLS